MDKLIIAGKQFDRVATWHFQDVGDRLSVQFDFKHIFVVSPRVALFARHPDVRQKVHLDPQLAAPLARLATSTRHIEGERSGGEPSLGCFGNGGEQLADQIKDACVSRWITAGCIA